MSKKVAFMIPGLSSGGAERVLSTISTNMDSNIKQYIFTWNGKDIDYVYNADIVDIDVKNSSNIIKNLFVLMNRIIKVKKYKKIYKIDTCVSHLEGANIVNLLSKGKEKVVITVHNFQSKERKGIYGFIFKLLMKILYNKADKVIAVSKLIKEDLVENFNVDENKVEVIYNPFDTKKIRELANEEIESEYKEVLGENYIISVGRLTKQKGQWHLIKAFSELRKTNKNVKLAILGKGELEDRLKELVSNLGLENEVIFLGFQSNPFKYIKGAKVFALTSLYEGFPMCLVEAMVCGTPIVSVDCKSGPREILDISNDYNLCCGQVEHKEYGILTPAFHNDDMDFTEHISEEEILFASALKILINDMNQCELYKEKGIYRSRMLDVDKVIKKWNSII